MTQCATPLFWCHQLPGHWLTVHKGQLVMWPAEENGWEKRAPYRGHWKSLIQASPAGVRGAQLTTGWPGGGAS